MIMSDMSLPQKCLMNQNPTVSYVLPPTTTSYLEKIVQKFSTVYSAWETWDGISSVGVKLHHSKTSSS